MNWSLVSEIGIEYAPLADDRHDEHLKFPTFAEQGDDGTYLIVDEIGLEKSLRTRTECRTILVDGDGNLICDSTEWGLDDGYGCIIDDGLIAILRRTTWELLIVLPTGKVIERTDLSTFSKRQPRFISWTWNKTFLIAFVHKVGDIDIIELDRQGRLLWCLPTQNSIIGFPGSMQLLTNGNILIADEFYHIAVEIQRDGSIVWQFGERSNPSAHINNLTHAKAIKQLPDGRRLVADTRNHRVLSIGIDGTVSEVQPSISDFCEPTFADLLSNAHYLICDASNARVVELDDKGNVVWQYGHQIASRRSFSFPRSVEATDKGHLLVSDSCHNRVVEVVDGKIVEWPVEDDTGLFWPRCARKLASGSLLIADGRNSRVVEVTAQGKVLRELNSLDLSEKLPLGDPHDVRLLPNGNLLIVDSSHNLVVEANWSGRVDRIIGNNGKINLNDPHCAQPIDGGCILICDTGHNRVIYVDPNGEIVHDWRAIYSHSSCLRLHRPRYAEISEDGILVIVDTDNNRIIAADETGHLIWELSHIPGSRLPSLRQPRWVNLINREEIVISDHYQHRILHLKHFETSSSKHAANERDHG